MKERKKWNQLHQTTYFNQLKKGTLEKKITIDKKGTSEKKKIIIDKKEEKKILTTWQQLCYFVTVSNLRKACSMSGTELFSFETC